MTAELKARLWGRTVVTETGCREFTGYRCSYGYGRIGVSGKVVDTHRVAWELANGPIPDGMFVCHHCDNPPCIETEPSDAFPDGHLFLGTQAENMADKIAKGRGYNQQKTHCAQGHPYDEANTYVTPKPQRVCRTCNRAAVARYKARRATS